MSELPNIQIKLIQEYYDKWLKVAFKQEKVDREKVTSAISNAYQLINKTTPQIIFCDCISDLVFQIWLFNDSQPSIIKGVGKRIQNKLTLGTPPLEAEINENISTYLTELWNYIEPIDTKLYNWLKHECVSLLKEETELSTAIDKNWITSFSLIYTCLYDDCRISILDLPHDPWVWSIYQSLATECFCFCPFKKVCFILERPKKILCQTHSDLEDNKVILIDYKS